MMDEKWKNVLIWDFKKTWLAQIIFCFALFILFASAASAGPIQEVFADSIFDVKWLSSPEDVQQKYPDGKLVTKYKKYGRIWYETKDGRTIMDLKRDPSNYMQFIFNSENQFNSIIVQFPSKGPSSYTELYNKIKTYFGEPMANPKNPGFTLYSEWGEDNGYKINVSFTKSAFLGKGTLHFTIDYVEPVAADKGNLGF